MTNERLEGFIMRLVQSEGVGARLFFATIRAAIRVSTLLFWVLALVVIAYFLVFVGRAVF